ncbi:MAG: glucose 1-dehydrogenase [Armatimonadetes bacterium]|nr:glucose 1-dehydrogenase [Armatimonadota bacterium]
MGQLSGKVAVITGASSGIGKAIALAFGAEGAKVIVNYLGGDNERGVENKAKAEAIVETIGAENALAFPCDVSKREQVQAMVDAGVERFGRLDIAVNNAGIEIKRDFLDVPDHEWGLVMDVNLHGAFYVTQIAGRQFVKQEAVSGRESRGKIVNISSTHEDIPFPGYTSYCVSKGGIRMLCRDLAVYFAPMKININNIAPGAIATPINQSVLEDAEEKANALSEIPYGRFGTPEEMASLAVFLASEQSNYISGSTFYADGALALQVTKY